MNTEKLKTLVQIHKTIASIEQIRGGDSISIEQQLQLEKIAVKLWNMEQSLIRRLGTDLTDSLAKESESLNRLAKKLKLDSASLKTVTVNLEKAIKLTKAFTKILKIALIAGLV